MIYGPIIHATYRVATTAIVAVVAAVYAVTFVCTVVTFPDNKSTFCAL